MELLIYASEKLAEGVEAKNKTDSAAVRFDSALTAVGGKVQHASAAFGTIVVDVPDQGVGDFLDFLQSDDDVNDLEELQYQTRFNLSAAFAEVANNNPDDPSLKPLNDVLAKYDANMKNQYAAFVDAVDDMAEDIRVMGLKMNDLIASVQNSVATGDVRGEVAALQALKEVFAAFSERTTLHAWTKETIAKPGKKELYSSRYTAYADGGQEVYAKSFADGLEADLKALIPGGMVTKVNKFNSDPAQNPQAGPQFR